MVYVGPGEYVTGPINLRSNACFYVESGDTLYGSRDTGDWPGGRRAILFGDSLQNVTIGGRGTIDGGTVSDVIISNISIDCSRHDWFWWGQEDAFYIKISRRNENSPIGRFDNILIKDVIAHVKGSSILNGHPVNPLTGIRLENLKLFMSEDPDAYFREAVHAIRGRYFIDFTLKDVSVTWEEPGSGNWKSAIVPEKLSGSAITFMSGNHLPE